MYAYLYITMCTQAPSIDGNSDEGIIPDDNVSYSVTFNDVTFAYPSRPDTPVS